MPVAMLFGTTGEHKNILSNGTFSYFLAFASARTWRQCCDATQLGCRISRILRVGHGRAVSGASPSPKRSERYVGGGGGGGDRISSSSDTQVLVSERVVKFGKSERINLARAGGILNALGFAI